MEYTNPEIPEGINTSKQHPLQELFILLGGILLTIAVVISLISFFIEKFAVYIPFSLEQQIVEESGKIDTGPASPVEDYLDTLANSLVPHMELPEDMVIRVHYIDDPVVNASASIGGHIYIHRGLLEKIPDENTLAMVVAHEIAHIKYRHPVIAMGRGVVIGLLLTAITGASSDYVAGKFISDAGIVTLLTFNRNMEQQADDAAANTIVARYGDIGGALRLFEMFRQIDNDRGYTQLEIFSTHPMSEKRVEYIRELSRTNGWLEEAPRIELPDTIQALVNPG